MVKHYTLLSRTKGYWSRKLQLEMLVQEGRAGQKVDKEIRALRTAKSRLMDDFADALDAMIFLLSGLYRLGTDPDFNKDIRTKMKVPQFQEFVNELTDDILPSFDRILTFQRAEKLIEGIFRTSLHEGTDAYRMKLAAILMNHITHKVLLQLNFAMSSYLGKDLLRANELLDVISRNLEKPLARDK